MSVESLPLADVESLQDLGTYVGRARRLDADGAVRLQAVGGVLAAWVCVLPGQGLLGQGLVLGLRTMPLDPAAGPVELDTTVPLAAVTDRMARRAATGDVAAALPVPPTTVSPAWTALTPPRSGWEPVGEVPVGALRRAAEEGVDAVGRGTPPGAGAHAVATLRQRVWSAPVQEDGGPAAQRLPAGAGFAADALGFLGARDGVVHRSGPWTRLTLPTGYVLTR